MGGVGEATPIITNIELKGYSDLTKIVKTARGSRFFGNPACGGKTEGGQNAHDGDDGKELNQGECVVGFFHIRKRGKPRLPWEKGGAFHGD
jgi:hypothetical protein